MLLIGIPLNRLLRLTSWISVLCVIAYVIWLTPHFARTRIQRPLVERIQAANGWAVYDYQMPKGAIGFRFPPPGSTITRWLCGDDIYARVKLVAFYEDATTDRDVSPLYRLPELETVVLSGPGVTDDCIDDLLRICKLHSLALNDTSVTPLGLSRLSTSHRLRFIRLSGLSVSDEHVAALSRIGSVNSVALASTTVTDRAFAALGEIEGLTCLDLDSCRAITDAGLVELQKHPELKDLRVAGFGSALTDDSLKAIAPMPHLRRVTLCGRFSDDGVQELRASRPDFLIECQRSAFYHVDLSVEITAVHRQEGEPLYGL